MSTPRVARMLRLLLATSSLCTILIAISSLLILIDPILADSPNSPASASSQNSNQTHLTRQSSAQVGTASTSTTATSGKTSATDSKSKSEAAQPQVTIVEQQPTDLSSMYVQIPIAEPGDTGVQEGVQQTLTSSDEAASTGGSGQDSSKATSWTGPWPKKFQIGYIKQSDLHQVLIESLKNDPFVALASPSSPATKGGQAQQISTPSPPITTAAVRKTPEVVPQKAAPGQWAQNSAFGSQRAAHQQQQVVKNNNAYHRRPIMQSFRDTSSSLLQPFHMAHNRFHHQVNNFQAHQTRPMFNQQPQKLLSITGNPGFHQQQQQQQQPHYHFGFPMNSFKNEPMYTINNYPHQEQLDQNSMQLVMPAGQQQQQFAQAPIIGRPQTSAEYQTSAAWRPVMNGDKTDQVQQVQQQQQQQQINGKSVGQIQPISVDYPGLNDGFDDGFSAPTKDASAGSSMNRHPALNNYLSNLDSNAGNRSARMSPSLQAKLKQQSLFQVSEGAKTTEASQSAGSSKGGGVKSAGGIKGSSDGTNNLSASRRRALNGTSTTTTTSTGATNAGSGSTTTVAPNTGEPSESANSPTTMAPSLSITTSASSITTTTVESETQEPDSEVIDSDTTEQPSTTTGGSVESSSSSPSSGSSSTTTTTTSTTSTASTNDQNPQQESQTSTTASSVASGSSDGAASQTDSGESEVVTQGNSVQQQNVGAATSSSMVNNNERGSTVGSSSSTGSSREETTPATSSSTQSSEEPASKGGEVEGSAGSAEAAVLSKTRMDSTMSDEALLAASLKTGSEIGKTSSNNGSAQSASQQQVSRSRVGTTSGTTAATSGGKRTRSPERLVQASPASGQQQLASGGRKSIGGANSNNNKLITKRPQQSSRAAKQVSQDVASGVKGAKLSSGRSGGKTGKKGNSFSAKSKSAVLAASRSRGGQQSERLLQQSQQQPQVISMTAAQAQSTAQTLASLLLSRCMSSSSCAHLLDICTTKQAMVPLNTNLGPLDNNSIEANTAVAAATVATNNQSSAAWSMPVGLISSSIMSLTQSLQADRVLKVLPQWKDAIENVVDQDTQAGYTLILPSNEALDRLLPSTLDSWLANSELLSQIIDNHILDSPETIDFMTSQTGRKPQQSRVIRNKGLQVNQHREKMVTINGKRLVYANQAAPSGGRIHVIDGFLDWPLGNGNGNLGSAKLLDIMDTLKQCDKFDGFVTLAEGTGLTQILKQDGQMTVFVPSNEALRKIPDEELEVIKNNSTALKEFLMYHVVNGSYFSQDLRDGQQLASILDNKPIQVGVRVDGCSRRLVEANTSPMRRPDIVAKNGVIHILDWYLTVRDNEWCEPIGKFASTSPPPIASDRLQQLASETEATYATRMAMPINHKPAILSGQLNEGLLMAQSVGGSSKQQQQQQQQQQPLTIGSLAASSVGGNMLVSDDNTQNIIVTPTPLSSVDSLANSRSSA